MNSEFDVIGLITWVKSSRFNGNRDKDTFKVMDTRPTVNKEILCQCQYFSPVAKGDLIYASCVQKGKSAVIVKPPFVQVGTDKESLVAFFCKSIRGWSKSRAEELYDTIERIASDGKVDVYLSELSEAWMKGDDNDLLTEFSGFINHNNMSFLLTQWYHKFDKRRLWLLGLSNKDIRECLKICGSNYKIYDMCLKNPLRLYPIPMNKCMEILNRIKRNPDPVDLECGKVVRKMYENMIFRAWTCTPVSFLAKEFPNLSKIGKRLLTEYGVVKEYECAYLEYPYKVENYVANYLSRLLSEDKVQDGAPFVEPEDYNPKSPLHSRIEAEFRDSANLSEDQKKAIQGALDHKISLITGFPGTGKTTSIKEIVYNLEQRGIEYAICAFTGKAVARLREVLQSAIPMTFHLKIKKEKTVNFQHLIVDEASMVTAELFYEFIRRFDFPFNITLVGDPNQLPPIGWGSLFSQCIDSKTIPTYNLFINHRVYEVPGERDGIILNTKKMAFHGLEEDSRSTTTPGFKRPLLPMKFEPTSNFVLMPGGIDQITALTKAFKEQGINRYEITVITPYNRDLEIINKAFQSLYCGETPESAFDSRGKSWYKRDRVMMTKNDYEINVMNGEEGQVIGTEADTITVKFGEGREYKFPLEPDPKNKKYGYSKEKQGEKEAEEAEEAEERTVKHLDHSYAVSIHKGQGSEWNYVIIYLPYGKSNPGFINKNLIYTALTRARRALFFIGNIEELEASTIRKLPFRSEKIANRLLEKLPAWDEDASAILEGEDDYHNNYEDYNDDDPDFDGY